MTPADIGYASLTQQAQWIRTKALSPVEILEVHLQRVQSINPSLKAVVTLADGSGERAREAEAALMRGEVWGPLHGVPFTAKDCFDTAGVRTTRGSKLFENRIPSRDATAVARLKQAGAILLGKTNLPEFALWSETSNEVFGRTVNPWNSERTAGGSSGGEAATVAAGLSPLGIGTDLGGSNRLPSHYCGLVGFKPTQGRIPITGQFPGVMSRHLHVGPLTRTVRDAALALSVLLGPDGRDPYAVPVPAPDRVSRNAPLPPLKVGFFTEGPFAPVARTIQEDCHPGRRQPGGAGVPGGAGGPGGLERVQADRDGDEAAGGRGGSLLRAGGGGQEGPVGPLGAAATGHRPTRYCRIRGGPGGLRKASGGPDAALFHP